MLKKPRLYMLAVLGVLVISSTASAVEYTRRYDAPNKCPKTGTNCAIIVFPDGSTGIDVAGSSEPTGW
ncbi:hypothetical protein [Nannocystis sp. SCPEA4]|jgi:hypothetical protein|uniref:hypothetical protein n=1 Tax=Nannocystis sp. SCPEA4 TaxID=2996787 RepID=UPI002271C43A|nr:hypothetical protein [Nannocystis sp. SCPEA4]MCY1056340.1 hypothetical protein [Nannocystis sp. SCPEA4]